MTMNPFQQSLMGPPQQFRPPMNPSAAPQSPANPGFGQRLNDFLGSPQALAMAAGMLSGGPPGQAMGRGFQYAGQAQAGQQKQQRERAQQKATANYLANAGADPSLVELAKSGAGAEAFQMFNAQQNRASKAKTAGNASFGKSPIWGTVDGKSAVVQLSDAGTSVQTELPEGFVPNKGIEKVDLGTHWIFKDKVTGEMSQPVKKELRAAESEKAQGRAEGDEIAGSGKDLVQADSMLATIRDIKNDPNRERGTGKSSVFNIVPTTGGYDFSQKVKQLQGQTFLQAYQQLKGGGQITEVEGAKAEAAIARLATGQSEEAFLTALEDLESVVMAARQRVLARQGVQGASPEQIPQLPSARGVLAPGTVEDGFIFRGGNPADPNSWERQ